MKNLFTSRFKHIMIDTPDKQYERTNMKIRNLAGFERWAKQKFGPDWINHPNIQKTYGEELHRFGKVKNTSKDVNIFNLPLQFREDDIQLDLERVNEEFNSIKSSPQAAKGRPDKVIYENVLLGQRLEQFLLHLGFTDDNRKYMDVISPDGYQVDCKVIRNFTSEKLHFVKSKLQNRNIDGYTPKVDYMAVYSYENGIYEYQCTIKL